MASTEMFQWHLQTSHGAGVTGPPPAWPVTRPRPWRRAAIAVAALLAVAVLTAAATAVLRAPAASYQDRAIAAVTPVIAANSHLAGSLSGLTATHGGVAAESSARAAAGAVRSAQHTLAALVPGSESDRQLAGASADALTSELAWLRAAGAVLRHPAAPALAELGSLGVQAQAKFQALGTSMPGVASSFPDPAMLIRWARSVSSRKELLAFSRRVQSLLHQSQPAFVQINQLYSQMDIAAGGGVPDISLAQAESTISTVVSNRTALAASARALAAPGALAASVRRALVFAMDASLTNDQDISACLNQANTGTVAFIFHGCLDATGSSSAAATAAKHDFQRRYSRLRQSIGLPPSQPQF